MRMTRLFPSPEAGGIIEGRWRGRYVYAFADYRRASGFAGVAAGDAWDFQMRGRVAEVF